MYIPNPYFSNVPYIGDLTLDYILMEDGYPVLFVCKSNEKYFLCVCRTLIPEQKWVVSEILFKDLVRLLQCDIDVYDAFSSYKEGRSCIVKWKKDMPEEQYEVYSTKILNPKEIPGKGIFLSVDEVGNYLEQIKNRECIKEENNVYMESESEQYVATGVSVAVVSFSKNHYESDSWKREGILTTVKYVSFSIEKQVVNSVGFYKKNTDNIIKGSIAPAA